MRLFGFCVLVGSAVVSVLRCAPAVKQKGVGAPSESSNGLVDAGVSETSDSSLETERSVVTSGHYWGAISGIEWKLTTLRLTMVSSHAPHIASSGTNLWMAGDTDLYFLADGLNVTRKVFGSCQKVVIPTPDYFRGLFVDSRGAFTIGVSAKREPVLVRVAVDGKVTCDVVQGQKIVLGSLSGPDGVWVTRRGSGPLVFRTASGRLIPSLPWKLQGSVRLMAPATNRVWLEARSSSGHRASRLNYYDGKQWRRVPPLPLPFVRGMAADGSGNIWAIAEPMADWARWRQHVPRALARFDGKTWTAVPVPEKFSAHGIAAHADELWMFNERGVWQRRESQWRYKDVPNAGNLHIDDQGRVYVLARTKPGATTWLLHRFDPPAKTNL